MDDLNMDDLNMDYLNMDDLNMDDLNMDPTLPKLNTKFDMIKNMFDKIEDIMKNCESSMTTEQTRADRPN